MKLVSLLVSLPPELVGSLVLSKLGLADIVRLDTAALENRFRSDLFVWYKLLPPISSLALFPRGTTKVALKWLLRRNLSLKKLFFAENNMKHLPIIQDSIHKTESDIEFQIDGQSWRRYIDHPPSSAVLSKAVDLSLSFSLKGYGIPEELKSSLLLFKDLKSLRWSTRYERDTNLLIPLLSANAKLHELHVYCSGDRISNGVVAALKAKGETLATMVLGGSAITDAILRSISECCTMLTSFSMPYEEEAAITDVGLCGVIKGCDRLESFTADVDFSPSASLKCAFAHGLQLSRISMRTTLGDDALEARPRSAALLLELTCQWGVSSLNTMARFGYVLSNLTHLTIATIVESRADTLCAALRAMPHLRVLVISVRYPDGAAIPTAALEAVALGCALLTKLTVGHRMEDDAEQALIAIARNNPGLVGFKAETSPRGVGFTDAMLLALAQHCPDIQKVRLHYCERITDDAVIALARSCCKLTHLELPGSVLLTDASLYALTEHCPNLQRLNVDNCRLITEAAVMHLLRSCRKLNCLYIFELVLSEEVLDGLEIKFMVAINLWYADAQHY